MKKLLNYLKDELGSKISEVTIKDIRIGLIYTEVLLSTGHAVAYTPIHESSKCPLLPYAGRVTGKSQISEVHSFSDVILISGSTLLNKTVNRIYRECSQFKIGSSSRSNSEHDSAALFKRE